MSHKIPQPRTIPFLGNITDIDTEVPTKSFMLLAQQYGEIYKMKFLSQAPIIILNTHELCDEVSDESRFEKRIFGALKIVRQLVGDALFTAEPEEPNWGIAHRVLMPAFGPAGIRNMLEPMRDISHQLIQKWTRFGPDTLLTPSEDFTRLALDTLFLCAMNTRLNSFYSNEPPKFVTSMYGFLSEAGNRALRPAFLTAVQRGKTSKLYDDKECLLGLTSRVIAERKENPEKKYNDLLDTMLYAKDPKTGQQLPPDNIARNLITFMIAGFETTSGTLTFITYFLLKNPEALRKVRQEIQSVLNGKPVKYEDLSKLMYMQAVVREALRLFPPAPMRTATAHEDTTLKNGKYAVKKGEALVLNTTVIHRDPAVWGTDAEEFKPERMLDGKFEALPKNAWQPFGFGMRACIGRPFAWQEMLCLYLTLTTIFQTFDLSLEDPSYTLELKQSLAIRPNNFHIRARVRSDAPGMIAVPPPTSQTLQNFMPKSQAKFADGLPIYIFYGSNTGTSEGFAQTIANGSPFKGKSPPAKWFTPVLATLNSRTGNLPSDGPVIIVTATFEGQPADNAANFVDWLQTLSLDVDLSCVQYAVFGCGHPDWVKSYQRVPALIDENLEKRGAKKLIERGVGNVVEGNFFQYYENWEKRLWEALGSSINLVQDAPTLEVEVISRPNERAETLRQLDVEFGLVLENQVLTAADAPAKHHLEIKLPEGMTYRAGDYLTLLPKNPRRDVRRALVLFGLQEDDQVIISANGLAVTLPTGVPVSAFEVLSGYLELSQPATIPKLRMLEAAGKSDVARAYIKDLIDNHDRKVLAKRLSILTILEEQADIQLSFKTFLYMLPSMRPRQYSISSSPLWNPTHVTLTVSVIDSPSHANSNVPFLGVASNYIAGLSPGDAVHVGVRPSAAAFHPPADPIVPIILFCAGSGIAPFRGFIQERFYQKQSGREVHPILCFYGCRSPTQDYLYADSDLACWIHAGVLDMRPAFSRSPEASSGCKYVQDRIWYDRQEVTKAYAAGAKSFLCGSSAIAKGVKARFVDILVDSGVPDPHAHFDQIVPERLATDIFD